MKMYSSAAPPNCWKVLSVARELSLAIETIPIDLFNGDAKSAAFLAKNPNGRVPVLEEDGFFLWESNAILAYLASRQSSPTPLPTKPRERTEVDRWLYWESCTLSPAVWKVEFEKILLRAWRAKESLQDPQAARAWLYRIGTNVCLDYLPRSNARSCQTHLVDATATFGADDSAGPTGHPSFGARECAAWSEGLRVDHALDAQAGKAFPSTLTGTLGISGAR